MGTGIGVGAQGERRRRRRREGCGASKDAKGKVAVTAPDFCGAGAEVHIVEQSALAVKATGALFFAPCHCEPPRRMMGSPQRVAAQAAGCSSPSSDDHSERSEPEGVMPPSR